MFLLLCFFSNGFFLEAVARVREMAEQHLGNRLLSRNGIAFYSSLDEAVPIDSITQIPLHVYVAQRVKGKYGTGRRLAMGSRNVVLNSPYVPIIGTNGASFSMWIRPQETERRQDLILLKGGRMTTLTLCLAGGKLAILSVDEQGKEIHEEVPTICSAKKFTHVMLCVEQGRAVLYQNGRKIADVENLPQEPLKLQTWGFSARAHSPFYGDVDELTVFSRFLSEREVREISCSQTTIAQHYQPIRYAAVHFFEGFEHYLSSFTRVFDRAFPANVRTGRFQKEIPVLSVRMSQRDKRYFRNAHEISLYNGFSLPEATKYRKVSVYAGDRKHTIEMAIDDLYRARRHSKRAAYVLWDPEHELISGSGYVRVYPPELHTILHPDAEKPLPLHPTLVRFFVGDHFKGIYVLEALDDMRSAWMAFGSEAKLRHHALHGNAVASEMDKPQEGEDSERCYKEVAKTLDSDMLFPWSRQEIQQRNRLFLRWKKAHGFSENAPELVGMRTVLGENPAAMYVVTNLTLPKERLIWTSSNESVISSEGQVVRGEKLQIVEMRAREAETGKEQVFRFRVMPNEPTLPALFLQVARPIEKYRRCDFTCIRHPAGGGTPQIGAGTGGRGGVKHRGNTSYSKAAKRSMSLEFNKPVEWGETEKPVDHILLYSGYADATRLRNKIAFDSFLAMDDGDAPHIAPKISWSEVFINGEYFGVMETSARIRDICEDGSLLYKVRARNEFLWRKSRTEMVECITSHRLEEKPYEPLEELFQFVAHAGTEEFNQKVEQYFEMKSFMDWFLLLNFTGNQDGVLNNQIITRETGSGKWHIVPWDYDKTFFVGKEFSPLINHLELRMEREKQGYAEQIAKRWQELRAGELSDQKIFSRIEHDAELLAPYMEEDFRLVPPLGTEGDFASNVEALKTAIQVQLRGMDQKYGIDQP